MTPDPHEQKLLAWAEAQREAMLRALPSIRPAHFDRTFMLLDCDPAEIAARHVAALPRT